MRQVSQEDLIKIADYCWEIPQTFRGDMRVPARIYALAPLLEAILGDRSLDQLVNVATLPGIVRASMVMPDVHQGYGFPIGGIAATRYPDGAISPGGIGYDINCGVRLLSSDLEYAQARAKLEDLSKALYREIPSGVGRGGSIRLQAKEMDKVLKKGAAWAVTEGLGEAIDLTHTESHGVLPDADPSQVSDSAKQRGANQLGTIGAGNHFVEVDWVDEIYDEEAAAAFGLRHQQMVVLIHTGSRGLGHQTATDHLRVMLSAMSRYDIKLPDRELACVPFNSPEGQRYYHAMCAAANFAWANRQVITHDARKAWRDVFGRSGGKLRVLYDVAHNIAKLEEHEVDGERLKVIVHRKGATRAFGPGFVELPPAYRPVGQPVLIPGSMGTASYVLVGTQESMNTSFGSTCHGAGRQLSRNAAKKLVDGKQLIEKLRAKNIYVQAGSTRGVAEEAPMAYKDVDMVVETVHLAGIARKVARLRPVAVIKG
jgi:tRNA-splicing ligase RtcB